MLTEIKLTNFKCFKEETSIPLSRFNLFTGVNGGGKSTALQSLLLIQQSSEYDTDPDDLILNGSCVNLGCFDDVRNYETSIENPIIFELSDKNETMKYYLIPEDGDANILICDNGSHFRLNYDYEQTYFISADRIGPQELYQKSILPFNYNVGSKGEFTAHLLNKLAEELVDESLCIGDDAKTLITQAEAWLGKILNPLSLQAKILGKTNFLELLIGGFKPSNVGFGYSSLLPIIVTGLIAKPNEKIIIENPEIHLHPKAQSALIEFLIKVSNTGVQIFIESHSDHVLNSLRVATKEKLLSPEDSSILFFSRNTANNSSDIISILIDEKGKLHKKTHGGKVAKIPQGFFDEWTNSMAKLF